MKLIRREQLLINYFVTNELKDLVIYCKRDNLRVIIVKDLEDHIQKRLALYSDHGGPNEI